MKTNRYPTTNEELKDLFTTFHKTAKFALVYDQTEYFNADVFDERGHWEYVNECNIYEQVEFFNDIDSLNKRINELKSITNKRYSNFRIHNREHYVE